MFAYRQVFSLKEHLYKKIKASNDASIGLGCI